MRKKNIQALYTRLMNEELTTASPKEFENIVNDILPPGEPKGKKRKGEDKE